MAAYVAPETGEEGLWGAAGMLKELGRDAAEESRTTIRLTYTGES